MGKKGTVKWSLAMRILVVMVLAVVLVLQAACTAAPTAGRATVELKLAHFFPATHPAETVFVQGWIDAVKKATDGKVIITSYPGETLSKAADIYNAVVDGITDIGLSSFSYNKGRFPEMEAFEQPGIVYKNSKVASKVAWEGIQELNPASVKDTKLLMVIATGPGDLFTKTPIKTLEEIKGMQIRATGLSAETLGLLGATPVGMPQSEAYEALSRGMVSGNLAPIEVLKSWKHGEVTKHVTLTPFLYNNLFYVTINQKKWDAIPSELKKIILDVTAAFHEEVGIGLWDKQNEEALQWAIQERGMDVIELSGQEAAKWIQAVSPMIDKYVQDKGETGQKAVDIARRLSEKYNKEY